MKSDLNMMLVRVTGVAYVLPRSGKCAASNKRWLISRAGFVVPPHLSYSLLNRQLLASASAVKAMKFPACCQQASDQCRPERR